MSDATGKAGNYPRCGLYPHKVVEAQFQPPDVKESVRAAVLVYLAVELAFVIGGRPAAVVACVHVVFDSVFHFVDCHARSVSQSHCGNRGIRDADLLFCHF